ncbi:MAG TPA: hypothetical protein VGR02_19340 [Thermoanaerobaculia bacterium]|jgi:hypothetical protein|nr:hypothetical protein [Thermoanaerobaculia bacterium]
MRRLTFLFLFLLAATPLFAVQTSKTTIVEDVIRMAKAGVEDDTIIEFVARYDGHFDVNADDLIALTEAKVSKDVIKAVVGEADSRNEEADKADGKDARRAYVRPSTLYYPYYAPRYYSPYSYYDPFWYGPRFSIGFGFGYGGYYGGHYGRGNWGGGGHGGHGGGRGGHH